MSSHDQSKSNVGGPLPAIAGLEEQLWQAPHNRQPLEAYQRAFRELGDEGQHHFIIVIPVADRPQHLEGCLGSTLKLCASFGYGGREEARYRKVEVLIADDSREAHNIARHQEIAADFDERGLTCHYFGKAEQLSQLERLNAGSRAKLAPIIGAIPAEHFYHKGASIQRNIAYLKLHEMVGGRDDTLIYFIDSDQEFQVRVATATGEQNLYAINYLYQLDRIFRETDSTILTGKVVGDPPVSPSVMAGNFLADVTAFLQAMATHTGKEACSFHSENSTNCDDAAYHDMADLFGFKQRAENFDYPCTLSGEHDHRACFADFAGKLSRFFDGEHPTRKSYYEHLPLDDTIVPARTIYTGNYCFRSEALRYFIPFATLKLRMAGPVLGRIIKAEIGERFVSANLPMLHKRTVEEIGQSEFRPGIEREQQTVDLSGEFERQFFGDVMLFTMEQLTAEGYPLQELSGEQVAATVEAVEKQMVQNYSQKHQQIITAISALKSLFTDGRQWWQQDETLSAARAQFDNFISNMESNFGDDAAGYRQIQSSNHRAQRRAQIIDAILNYRRDRKLWQSIVAPEGSPT